MKTRRDLSYGASTFVPLRVKRSPKSFEPVRRLPWTLSVLEEFPTFATPANEAGSTPDAEIPGLIDRLLITHQIHSYCDPKIEPGSYEP